MFHEPTRGQVLRGYSAHPVALWRMRLRKYLFLRTHRAICRAEGDYVTPMEKEPWDRLEVFIMVVLVLNMITFAIDDPMADFKNSHGLVVFNSVLEAVNAVFAGIFLIESLLRFLCFGAYGFRRDLWNVVDLVIVIISIITIVADYSGQSIGSFSVLRTVRVFRPLRSVSAFPAVQNLVVSMIRAVKSLTDVALIYLMFVVIFGIVGVVQFRGELRTRCVRNEYWSDLLNDTSPLQAAYQWRNYSLPDFVCGGKFELREGLEPSIGCDPQQTCDFNATGRLLRGYQCPYGYRCERVGNPFWGMVSFDSLPQAVLTLFVCVSEETWSNICYMLMDSFDVTAAYYFIVVLVLGAFFIVNVSIVLITITFEASSAFQAQKASRLLTLRSRSNSVASTTAYARLARRRERGLSAVTVAEIHGAPGPDGKPTLLQRAQYPLLKRVASQKSIKSRGGESGGSGGSGRHGSTPSTGDELAASPSSRGRAGAGLLIESDSDDEVDPITGEKLRKAKANPK